MNLVIYSSVFAPEIGGTETIVMSLAEGLARSGAREGEARLKLTVVTPTPARGFGDSSLPFRVMREPNLRQLVRALRSADIVHLAGPALLPMLLGLLLRKPVVVEHHNMQVICPNGQLHYEPTRMPCPGHFMARRYWECLHCNAKHGKLRSLKTWLLTFPRRWLSYFVSRNIAPTQWLESILQLPRTVTVFHGVQCSPASGSPDSRRLPPTFAFVGRLVGTKGVHTLLQAAGCLKEKGLRFQLKIVGDGPERRNLEAQAESLLLNDCVTFLGHLPPAELEQILAAATAVVMPSLGGEVFGLVAAETMARGQLPIVSEIGPLSEVVGGAGLKFAPGDFKELATCLEQVMTSPELVANLRQRAHSHAAEYFAHASMIDGHLALYRRMLSERGVSR